MNPLLILLPLLLLSAAPHAETGLQIENAWVREAPPGAPMLAAYMTLRNTGDTARVLVSVDSPRFRHVMIHRTTVVDGMARMQHLERLSIPARGSVALEPGAYHLMLPAPDTPLRRGDIVEFRLHFANGEVCTARAVVKRSGNPP